ncbi:DNA polymerase delta subunit 4-like [Actinia tenebrosa]|uniref:DNA polymerase delta subunit 4-like n=1 Tax=Actinia tenebrosa TaxID=6105 RepID=A0A6P8HIP0_ACTTE|nr:DNA polymerase delta subunit 4-like [Actinia tenebrosa]
MSNKLITDTFPTVKKQKVIKQKPQSAKTQDKKAEVKKIDVGVSVQDEKTRLSLLKEFDLNSEYGPCIGISRLQRWERAEKFGLHPSQDIKDIITQHLDDETYTECIWKDEKL